MPTRTWARRSSSTSTPARLGLHHAVSPAAQQAMTAGLTFTATATLDIGHASFLSSPDLVVATLLSFE
jgi:hypothetical protein